MDSVMLEYNSSGVMATCPTQVDRHRTWTKSSINLISAGEQDLQSLLVGLKRKQTAAAKQKCGQNKKYNPNALLSNLSQTGTSVTFHLFQQFKCMQDWSRNQSTAFKETWKQNFHLEAGDHHYHVGMWTTSECKRVLSKGLDNTCQFI